MDDSKSNNVEEDSIKEEMSRIKGDVIGDTVYSERWVLKHLIKLSKCNIEEWNSSFEEELCLLWDMTTEEDIVNYLLAHDFPSLFLSATKINYKNARFMEIMIGILGNMCSNVEVRKTLSKRQDICCRLIEMLQMEDSLSIIQVIRLLNTYLWNYRNDLQQGSENELTSCGNDYWIEYMQVCQEDLINQLGFYLASSTNEELICSTLKLLDTLFNISTLKAAEMVANSQQLIRALAESLKQLLSSIHVGDSVLSNKNIREAFLYWISLTTTLVSFDQGRRYLGTVNVMLVESFTNILRCLPNSEFSEHEDPDSILDFISLLQEIDLSLDSESSTQLFSAIHRTLRELENLAVNDLEPKNRLQDLIKGLKNLTSRILNSVQDLTSITEKLQLAEVEFLRSFTISENNGM